MSKAKTKNLNQEQRVELKIQTVKAQITIPSNVLVATPQMQALVNEARITNNQSKLMAKALEALKDKIRAYMGSYETMITPDGVEIVTYIQQDLREEFDKAALKEKYPEIYQEFVTLKTGLRPVVLK